jgi:uncharacterized protein (TIGR01777 family)
MTSPLLWALIVLQIAMGAFDMVYHHELTERLAWRPSQRRELALHGVRNLLYAGLLIALGWLEVHGIWSWLLMGILTAEVLITLMDFVEEDVSRKLPASERINHTLLALNYGAILALAGPVLVDWSRLQTGLALAFHGVGSLFAALAAAGVAAFGIRDVLASRRLKKLTSASTQPLALPLPARQHVLVTGATGFIGRRLVEVLAAAGHHVIVLVRDPAAAAFRAPFQMVTSLDQIASDTAIDAIVNLAGEPIATRPWSLPVRRRILRSRIKMTRDVVRLMARLDRRPAVLINGSAIGWYGLWQDESLTEFDGGKSCFTHRVCEVWARSAKRAERLGVRVVRLRIGLVLGIDGGLLARLLLPFEFGLGGPIGSGRQWMSWIEREDLIRLIAHIMATPSLTGAVNATAPTPVPNAEFARELGRALHRPALLRLPAPVLHHLLGGLADELLLGGQRVLPDKAQLSGFKFRNQTLREALLAIFGQHASVDVGSGLDPAQPAAPNGRQLATGVKAA